MYLLVEYKDSSFCTYKIQDNISVKWVLAAIKRYLNGHIRTVRVLSDNDLPNDLKQYPVKNISALDLPELLAGHKIH